MRYFQGVLIPGLGTFTFSQKKLDVGNNKYLLIQRPIFILLEKFCQTHQIHVTKYHVTGNYIHELWICIRAWETGKCTVCVMQAFYIVPVIYSYHVRSQYIRSIVHLSFFCLVCRNDTSCPIKFRCIVFRKSVRSRHSRMLCPRSATSFDSISRRSTECRILIQWNWPITNQEFQGQNEVLQRVYQ